MWALLAESFSPVSLSRTSWQRREQPWCHCTAASAEARQGIMMDQQSSYDPRSRASWAWACSLEVSVTRREPLGTEDSSSWTWSRDSAQRSLSPFMAWRRSR